jgi:hypothetical protein
MSLDIRPGDVVGRPKGLWTHVGVVDGSGVWHVAPGEPFRRTSLQHFAAGKPIKLLHRPAREDLWAICQRARQYRGTEWRLWQNCQDVAWKIATDQARSPGRVGTLAGLTALLLGGLAVPAVHRALTTHRDRNGHRRDRRGRFA